MKLRNTLYAILTGFIILTAISCEDMLKVDSKIVLYDYENTLDKPTDTVYSVLGIIKNMQKIADRTVILGEIRGDLVSATSHANKDLAELYDYHLQDLSSNNRYNNAADYYAVINNCNYFLAHADTALVKDRQNVFLREYISVLSYRAWTYLQLAQAYGQVYYVDKPILSGDEANESKWPLLNIKEIANLLLADFEERYILEKTPNYGSLSVETGSSENSSSHTTTDFFIPVRLIMGDLALWGEQYDKAAIYYHDFISNTDTYRPTDTYSIVWFGDDFMYLDPDGDTYASNLGANAKHICYIPMEADEYNGIVSDLPNIFNSTADNDYWYQLTRSKSLTSLSQRQKYCVHYINPQNEENVRTKYVNNKLDIENELLRGDLRLQSVLSMKSRPLDEYSLSNVSTSEQKLIKINAEKIWLYRNDVVYLRLAEALNRAGLPQMAFAVLKTGLYSDIFTDSTSTVVSKNEIERAKSKGMEVVTQYRSNFKKVLYRLEKSNNELYGVRTIEGAQVKKENSVYDKTAGNAGNTMGIHSRGSGDAAIDTTYTIGKKLEEMGLNPLAATLTDSIRAVEEFLIDEMALETCFEGYRFGDLMRISMHRAADTGGAFAENDFLAKRVATRASATMDNAWAGMDMDLYDLLKGDGNSLNPNWFLKLK